MIQIAINVMWFLIGVVILAGVIYMAMWVIDTYVHVIPEKVKQGILVVFLLLCLIGLLTAIVGGGSPRFPSLRGEPSGAPATLSTGTGTDLQERMLSHAA